MTDETTLVSVLVEVETTRPRDPDLYVRREIERALRERFLPTSLRITPLPRMAEMLDRDTEADPGLSPVVDPGSAPITPDMGPPDVSEAHRTPSGPFPGHEPRPFPGPLDTT